MRHLIVLATVVAALAATATASAGGWATVGMYPLPDGAGPGDDWDTELTILQHGNPNTPLSGLQPTITITLDDTGRSETFTASETEEAGVYAATVVFPEAGQWRIVADSTFGDSRLTYGPVLIEPNPGAVPAGDGSGTDFPVLPVVVVIAGIALALAALFGVRRQRRLHPAG
jgi:YtkA-like